MSTNEANAERAEQELFLLRGVDSKQHQVLGVRYPSKMAVAFLGNSIAILESASEWQSISPPGIADTLRHDHSCWMNSIVSMPSQV